MTHSPLSARGLTSLGARHPWKMIGAWLVVFAIVFGLATAFGTEAGGFTGGDTGVDVESQQGQNLIDQHFGKDDRANDLLVITSDTLTVDDPAFRAVAESAIGQLDAWQPDIASLANYYAMPADAPEASALVSDSRHSLIVPVTFNEEPDAYSERGGEYVALFDGLSTDDVKIYELGDISGDHEISTILEEDLGKDMSVGMPVAGVVLLVVFGALIAAVLPLALALVTIGLASLVLTVIGGFMTVDGNANTLVIMIGLAVGVDYALFFLERFREERKHGAHKIDAIERAGATAGKAVIFSGITVVLAMLGLFVLPMPLFHGMGLGAASAVVIAVLAAVTLLPALLRLLGDFTNFPRFGTMRKLKRQDATGVAQFADTPTGKGVWGRMATRMMHRPGLTAVIAIAFLLLCTAPVATIEMGTQTNETLPPSSLRSAALVLDREFAAGENEPVRIVIEGDATDAALQAQVSDLVARIAETGNFGTAAVTTSPDNALTVVDVPTIGDPYDPDTVSDIRDVRSDIIPAVFGDASSSVFVSGEPALSLDFDDVLIERLPIVFGLVLGLSFLLLLVAFRSIVVPFTAIVMNLLSVGAAYGLLVLVFQHGIGNDVLGLTHTPVITSWIPVMLFCILFGLSMDYHVFLLSRIREHWDRTHDNEVSIVAGLQSTGRIITGAALIMVSVFSAFMLGRMAELQQMGFGLGVAVLIDATLIRTVLVPSTMKLLGRANWYLPRFLSWLPDFRVEGDLAPIRLERQDNPQRPPASPVRPRTSPSLAGE